MKCPLSLSTLTVEVRRLARARPSVPPARDLPAPNAIRRFAASITFAVLGVAGGVVAAQPVLIKNGGMTQGDDLPDEWRGKFGEVEAARDTTIFKEGPASLRVRASGGKSGSAFQQIKGGAGAKVRIAGWIKSQGNVRAQAMVHAFAEGFKQNQFIQLHFTQGDSEWAQFEKEIELPAWTAFFNVGLMAEGDGTAWLDEVRAGGAPVDPGVAKTPQQRMTSGPPPKGKPWEPGWGFYPQHPQAWQAMFQSQLERSKNGGVPIVFLGDSITQGWPDAGKAAWAKHFAPLGAVSYGIGGDSTRQVLWRIENGLFEGIEPRLVVLKIGTNNLYDDHNAGTDEEIARGIEAIVKRIREKLPKTRVLLLGVLPRQNEYFSGRIVRINEQIAKLGAAEGVTFLDVGERFAKTRGKGDVRRELFHEDQLHLTPNGYDVFAEAIAAEVKKLAEPGQADAETPRKEATLYAGGERLPVDWFHSAWGGAEIALDTVLKPPGGAASIRVAPRNPDVQPWAGASLKAAPEQRGRAAVKFPAAQWDRLALNLTINGGRNVSGQLEGGQPVQFAAEFALADGSARDGGVSSIWRFIEGGAIDDDPQSWQRVSIPLGEFRVSAGERAKVAGLSGVTAQFAAGTPVLAGVNIGSIAIGPQADFLTRKTEIKPPAADPKLFPEFAALKPSVLAPRDPRFTIDAHGNWCLDGSPRFLIGAQVPELYRSAIQPTGGYPREMAWIYDEPLDYERAQRLGFDALGYFTTEDWVRDKFDPQHRTSSWPPDRAFMSQFFKSARLPLYVDFTCAPWSNGTLFFSKKLPAEAKNTRGMEGESTHWVPYAALHPEGRKVWREMFADGARHVVESGGKPLFYELFNEPSYDDPSEYNRAEFARRLEKEHGSIAALNKLWRTSYADFAEVTRFKNRYDHPALFVAWSKFMEDVFVELCAFAKDTIREVDPDARVCVQTLGGGYYRSLPWGNVNLHKLHERVCDVASTETRAGIEFPGTGQLAAPPARSIDVGYVAARFEGMVHRHFMRSISRGKPIHDGEHYIDNFANVADSFWLQVARGGNGAFIFKWDKRAWDQNWGADKGPEGGRKMAELFPYCVLNPYSVAPSRLAGIMQFKRELLAVEDIFAPRQNFAKADIAVLLSYPSHRYGIATKNFTHDAFRSYAVALDFSHYALDVILEEQLAERLGDYKMLVAAGVSAIAPGTGEKLRAWVEKGGRLVLALEAMQLDEYGNAQPQSWLGFELGEVIANAPAAKLVTDLRAPWLPGEIEARAHRATKAPLIFQKKIGRGEVTFINAKMGDYAIASVLGGIAERAGLRRHSELTRADNGELEVNVEARKFRNGKLTGWVLYNWDRYAKTFRFHAPEIGADRVALIDPLTARVVPLTHGEVRITLPAAGRQILVSGPSREIRDRFKPKN